jgi:DNA-binding PadR family transcriptional regulator
MRSRVNWGVLGLLIERQGHGYDLFQRFQRTYGSLIELTHQRAIYKALKALEQRGLIEELPADVAPREQPAQPKLRYRARAEAVPAYREWLIAQVSQERQQLELLALQVGALPPPDALVVVDRYERALFSEREQAPPALDRASVLARDLAEQAKQLETGVALEWTAEARRELEAAINAQAVLEDVVG